MSKTEHFKDSTREIKSLFGEGTTTFHGSVGSTAIILSKDRKVLIVQRQKGTLFEDKWSVPGGKLENDDGKIIHDDSFIRYFSSEERTIKEVKEEVGIKLDTYELKFLCSITSFIGDFFILSFYCTIDKDSSEIIVLLNHKECKDYKWISEDEIPKYSFIPWIGEEIREAFKRTSFP